ncbi:MAG: hypothetical protein ACRCVG_06785 [Methanobacteriaceae archaeon]
MIIIVLPSLLKIGAYATVYNVNFSELNSILTIRSRYNKNIFNATIVNGTDYDYVRNGFVETLFYFVIL